MCRLQAASLQMSLLTQAARTGCGARVTNLMVFDHFCADKNVSTHGHGEAEARVPAGNPCR